MNSKKNNWHTEIMLGVVHVLFFLFPVLFMSFPIAAYQQPGGMPSSEALYPCLLTVHALEFTLPSVRVNTSLREESWQLFASFTQQSPYFPSKLENKSDVPLYSKLHLPFPLSSLTFLNVIIILSPWLRKYPFSFVLPIYCVCPQQTAAITLTHAVIVFLSTGYLPRMYEKWVIR